MKERLDAPVPPATLNLCELAVAANPKDAELQSWLAAAQASSGRGGEAVESFRAAAEGGDVEAMKALGLARLRGARRGPSAVPASGGGRRSPPQRSSRLIFVKSSRSARYRS